MKFLISIWKVLSDSTNLPSKKQKMLMYTEKKLNVNYDYWNVNLLTLNQIFEFGSAMQQCSSGYRFSV